MLSCPTIRKNGIIEKLKQETNALKNELETSESNLKKSNKAFKMKEKEIHDLKKESDKAKDDLAQVNREFKELKNNISKQKKSRQGKQNPKTGRIF
jgi:chromosome segregation ATPase